MKKGIYLLVLLVAATVATGCFFDPMCCDDRGSRHSSRQIMASGNVVSEERSVSSFSGIRLEGIGKVLIKQGTAERVRVEADDNIIKDVITEVSGRSLVIRMDGKSYKHPTVRIYITMKTLDDLKISGAGDLETESPVECDNIRCALSGAGNITLEGKAKNLEVYLSGAGNFKGRDLEVKRCEARVSGVGNCDVFVTEELDAVVSGVGNITYRGDPPEVRKDVSGFGKIRAR